MTALSGSIRSKFDKGRRTMQSGGIMNLKRTNVGTSSNQKRQDILFNHTTTSIGSSQEGVLTGNQKFNNIDNAYSFNIVNSSDHHKNLINPSQAYLDQPMIGFQRSTNYKNEMKDSIGVLGLAPQSFSDMINQKDSNNYNNSRTISQNAIESYYKSMSGSKVPHRLKSGVPKDLKNGDSELATAGMI